MNQDSASLRLDFDACIWENVTCSRYDTLAKPWTRKQGKLAFRSCEECAIFWRRRSNRITGKNMFFAK
jgi:hypothetical protein